VENNSSQNTQSPFDKLSESQQMAVLNFMSLTNTEDTDKALKYMKKASFILDRALEMFFSGNEPGNEETKFEPTPTMANSNTNWQNQAMGFNQQIVFDPSFLQFNNGNANLQRQNSNTQRNSLPTQSNQQNLTVSYRKHAEKKTTRR